MDGGVLRRAGHTEAAVDLAKLAGFAPVGALVEILNENGTMARLPDLIKIAKKFKLKIITIQDLVQYRVRFERLVERMESVKLPTDYGDFQLVVYREIPTQELHLALVKGEWTADENILVRVHSSCVTGDIFASQKCDCGQQLQKAMQMIDEKGKGVILYMRQEGRGIGFLNKIKAYKLREEGYDTVEANVKLGLEIDNRDYGIGAQILKDLNISNICLISNNPAKRAGIAGYGLKIVEKVALQIKSNPHNIKYLKN